MDKIRGNFPPSFKCLREGQFLKNSRSFVDTLLASEDKLSQILKTLPSTCEFCDTELDDWVSKNPRSYFITMGHIREIKVRIKACKTFKRAFYPEFYQYGLIFVHNKFVVTIELVLDILNTMKQNGSLIESIKDKLLLLGQLEGLDPDTIQKDLTNNSVRLEKMVIGVSTLLVKEEDIDDVTCYICGNCPKSVSTDGNTKDSIKKQSNMIYDYDDDAEIPPLATFVEELTVEVLCSAFFQMKTGKKFNMLKIPALIAPCLTGKQVNNEQLKKTIMQKLFQYPEHTIQAFQELVENKEIRLSRIKDLRGNEIQELAKKLSILDERKSAEMLKNDLINLSNIFLGGQVSKLSFLTLHVA